MRFKDLCALVVVLVAVIGAFYIDQLDSGSCYWIALLLYIVSRG